MKNLKYLRMLVGAGVLMLAAECVHEGVTYVNKVPSSPNPPPEPQPPPAPAPIIRSAAEHDKMLAPIALYPDPLTAQILPAATVPDQVAAADQYLRARRDPPQIEYQPWEQSIKALTRYPDVLRMMAGNLPWTTDLGIAFVNQQQDVMDSVQRLRLQARNLGNLQTTPEQVVIVEDRVIQLVPARPEFIYVPVYRPEIVFVRPPPPRGLFISFVPPLPIGPWFNHDLNWRNHEVIVWHPEHPRPHNWWYEPPSRHDRTVVVNNTTVVNNYTVWQPRNRPEHAERDRTSGRGMNRIEATPPPQRAAPGTLPAVPTATAQTRPGRSVTNNATAHADAAKRPAAERPVRPAPRPTAANTNAKPLNARSSTARTNSIPLTVETHRDPVPRTANSAAAEHKNAAPGKELNEKPHAAKSANASERSREQAERHAEKKGPANKKAESRKASERGTNAAASTNRLDQPR